MAIKNKKDAGLKSFPANISRKYELTYLERQSVLLILHAEIVLWGL